MVKLTFFGTSGAIPTKKRNHISMLLNFDNENILVDCGEGTQRQFKFGKFNPQKLTRLLITHWHGDHVLGIPGLLQTLFFSGYSKTLYIYGPKGTKQKIKNVLVAFPMYNEVKIKVEEVAGNFLETDNFSITARPLVHGGIPVNGYVFVKKGKIKIDKKKLKKSKIPSGPLLKKLKQGKDIIYKGKKYSSKNLTFKEPDKKVSFILDTVMDKEIIAFVKNSDLIVSEATYDSSLEELAKEHGHLTAKQAAEIAKKSLSKKLILIHSSDRYTKDASVLLKEAKSVFKNSEMAEDFDRVEI